MIPATPQPTATSHAPYNFVPQANPVLASERQAAEIDHSRFVDGYFSGTIDLRIITETPLYVRAGVDPEYAHRNPEPNDAVWRDGSQYREFRHNGDLMRPVIPGASLRGAIRQIVEVLTSSELQEPSSEAIVYRAVGDSSRFGFFYRERFVGPAPKSGPQRFEYPLAMVRGGYLRKQGRVWTIRPAKNHNGVSFVHVEDSKLQNPLPRIEQLNDAVPSSTAKAVWVEPASPRDHEHNKPGRPPLTLRYARTDQPVYARTSARPSGYEPAWLVLTAAVGSKHMQCAIFEPDTSATPIKVPDEMRQQYENDRAVPRARTRAGRDLGVEVNGPAFSADGVPCFYLVENGELVFFGPTLFFRLPYRNPPSNHRIRPRDEKLDMASVLFGTVRPQPVRGRLRFEDAEIEPGQASPWLGAAGYTSPSALLAPKPACIQHYLVQPSTNRDDLRHYDRPAGEVELRGFKFYWHRRSVTGVENDPRAVPEQQRKTRTVIRPVKPGIRFAGRIRFDNLTPEELGALLVALELKASMRHKIGMVRPFGYGSIRIDTRLHLVDQPARYESFFGADGRLHEGWRSDDDTVQKVNDARGAFALCVLRQLQVLNAPKAADQALARLWEMPRMKDLAAMLEWDNAPDQRTTESIPVQNDARSDQWRRRWLLPPPQAVLRPGQVPPPRFSRAHWRPRGWR